MKKISGLLIITLMFFSACDYDFSADIKTQGTINPTYAVALVDANFTLEELLPDNADINRYLEIDNDGFMTLFYKESLPPLGVNDFLSGSSIPLPLAGPYLPAFDYALNETTIDLNLNINLNGGSITFFDPKVKIIMTNFWNIPLQFSFSNMKYYPEGDTVGKDVTGSFVNDTHIIGSPTVKNDSVVTTLEMNTGNSNIDEVLSSVPTFISAGAVVGTPGQSTPFDLTGANDNKVNMEIVIPLNLSMDNVLFTDTLDFDLGVNTDSTKVKNITINFEADNGFPLGMNIQVYFLDNNFVIVDSLFSSRFDMEPASVSNGIVNTRVQSKVPVSIPESRMDNILNAKYMMPHIKLRTTDATNLLPVKIYSTYDIGLQLSAKMELELIL
ncbi:MAG: hypothetical protein L3J74_14080 [Bacteroidales bacterium]|nr:hypothetical protein [Bacteroidales bacterium]